MPSDVAPSSLERYILNINPISLSKKVNTERVKIDLIIGFIFYEYAYTGLLMSK